MSKMKDKLIDEGGEVSDSRDEHIFHDSRMTDCSACWPQNSKERIINAWKTVNDDENVIPRVMRNPHGDNYPLGYSPE